MKKLLIAAALLCTAGLLTAETVESIVARVGDRIITRSQYSKRLQDGLEEIRQTTPPDQVAARQAEFKSVLINDMLAELLVKDRADRLNISVTPSEIQEAVGRLKKQYGIESDSQFNDSLQKSGLTRTEMESRLRDSLLSNKVFSKELRSREELTDRELRERYDREKERYRLAERAQLSEIILLIPENATPTQIDAIRERATAAGAEAKSGTDFTALVKKYSEAPSKDQDGKLGVVTRGELLPELDTPVFSSAAPAILGPIQSKVGFHVLKLEARIPSEVPSFDTLKDRLRKDASEETFQRDYKAYIDKLRKDAFIQIHEDQIPAS